MSDKILALAELSRANDLRNRVYTPITDNVSPVFTDNVPVRAPAADNVTYEYTRHELCWRCEMLPGSASFRGLCGMCVMALGTTY